MHHRKVSVVAVVCLAFLLAGCPKAAQQIRDGVAALNGFLVQAQTHHGMECKAEPTKALCQSINRAGAVQNATIDFVKVYCEGPRETAVASFKDGGPCIEQKGMEPRANAVLRELNQTIADIKAIAGK